MSSVIRTILLIVIVSSSIYAQLSFLRPISTSSIAPIKRLYAGSTGKLSVMNFAVKSISPIGLSSSSDAIAMSPILPIDPTSPPAVTISGRAVNYPNPFRKSEGTTLFYTLAETGTVDIAIFDMMARPIVNVTRYAWLPGATIGQNRVPLTDLGLNSNDLSSGVYLFVILTNGKVIGKGKMAVI